MDQNYNPTTGMTPAGLHQLRRLKSERRPEACFGCGLEHGCSLHGCAVLRKAVSLLDQPPSIPRSQYADLAALE